MNKTIKKITNSRLILLIAVILVAGLYCLRVFNLDQDLPAWGVAFYQPKDEGCYALLAVNEWEYGTITPENPLEEGTTMLVQEHMRTNLLGNFLEIASFHLFGDNYYGLRMPMVLIGFLNLLLLGLVLLQLRKRYGNKTMLELWGILGLLLAVSLHFYFYLSSRTVEPSTLRMLFAQLTMLIWLVFQEKPRTCFFLMGLCITTSVFLVYITNVFLYLAVVLLLIMIWATEGWQRFLQCVVWFAIGSLSLFAVAEIYYYEVWGCSALSNFLGAIGLFTGVNGYQLMPGNGALGFIFGIVRSFVKFFSAFFFLYAPALLELTVLLLPVLLYEIVAKRDKTLFFMLAVPVSFLLQTMVSEDYIWRKLLVTAPYFIYMVFWGGLRYSRIQEYCKRWYQWCGTVSVKWKKTALRVFPPLYLLATLGFTTVMVLFHVKFSSDLGKLDMTFIVKGGILLLGCMPVLVWGLVVLLGMFWKRNTPVMFTVLLLGVSTLVLNLGLLTYYVWANPTFEERDMMISLSEDYDLDGKYVTGDYVMGVTLYNDMKPLVESHTMYADHLIAHPELQMFLYAADAGMRDYLDNTIFSLLSVYTAKQIETVPGTIQINGKTRNFGLYTAAPREEVVRETKQAFRSTVLSIQQEMRELDLNEAGLSREEVASRKEALNKELSTCFDPYTDYYGDRQGSVLSPIYVDTYGSIYGDVYAPIYGRVFGDIYGDVYAPIQGGVYGDIYGDIHGEIEGEVCGTVYGTVYAD